MVAGELRTVETASNFRSDLALHGLNNGNCAFSISGNWPNSEILCKVGDHIIPRSGNPAETTEERAGQFWDTISSVRAQMAVRSRWTESPRIIRDHNNRVCGRDIEGSENQGVIELFRDRAGASFPIGRAVSVGCGPAFKEMHLLQEGVVSHFDLFDVSADAVRIGRNFAEERGLSSRMNFVHGYDFKQLTGPYDMVYWDSALHHMPDADDAVRRSKEVLRPGGWLVMADFVGSDRFQWPSSVYDLADIIRQSLPEYCFANPVNPAVPFDRRLHRVTLSEMDYDPSEAADSEAIIPAIERYFPDALIKHVGGTVYHMVLNDALTNIQEDSDLLDYLLCLDRHIDISTYRRNALCGGVGTETSGKSIRFYCDAIARL